MKKKKVKSIFPHTLNNSSIGTIKIFYEDIGGKCLDQVCMQSIFHVCNRQNLSNKENEKCILPSALQNSSVGTIKRILWRYRRKMLKIGLYVIYIWGLQQTKFIKHIEWKRKSEIYLTIYPPELFGWHHKFSFCF